MRKNTAIIIVLFGFVSIQLTAQTYDAKLVLKYINDARSEGQTCGRKYMPPASELEYDQKLEKISQEHADDMQRNELFSHTGSDGRGAEIRLDDAGYPWKMYGENIGRGYKDEYELVKGWLESPSHCVTIMNPEFTHVGVGSKGEYSGALFVRK